jgi:hypothetical protein
MFKGKAIAFMRWDFPSEIKNSKEDRIDLIEQCIYEFNLR